MTPLLHLVTLPLRPLGRYHFSIRCRNCGNSWTWLPVLFKYAPTPTIASGTEMTPTHQSWRPRLAPARGAARERRPEPLPLLLLLLLLLLLEQMRLQVGTQSEQSRPISARYVPATSAQLRQRTRGPARAGVPQ